MMVTRKYSEMPQKMSSRQNVTAMVIGNPSPRLPSAEDAVFRSELPAFLPFVDRIFGAFDNAGG
jgi:hypothetical protein